MRPRHDAFRFTHRAVHGRTLRLGYLLHGGPSPDAALEEILTFPMELDGGPAIAAAAEALHLAAGVSYWKTSCPRHVDLDSGPLDPRDADFFGALYREGLGEFFHRNGLEPFTPDFPRGEPALAVAAPSRADDGPPLVLVGGGKDSAVSIELLRAHGDSPVLFAVGRHPWILRSAEASGFPLLVAERALAPGLFELNRAGALNGHVPVTAIVQLVAQVAALAAGFTAVVASNERSADEGSVVEGGAVVNHQWSKGLACERGLQAWSARHVRGGPVPFSLLRPWSELAIAAEFARHPRYFASVTSCNANFSLARRDVPRWCGRCPKCLFVFAVTVPWLDDAGRARLFGADFFADAANVPLAEELLGLARHKPFECVGTADEMRAALWLCHERGLSAASPVMALFRERVLPLLPDPAALVAACLRPSDDHAIPPRWADLHAAARPR